ncbi:MAG: transcription termination/antitermination protein NusG [Ruminococcus sp.]|jgi:transcriptional antiterminator NusG|nr:transcription termination/antitermination protein NusG [Ruminococcus sp.]
MTVPQWYVVHTYSGYENKVKETILKTVENRDDLKELITEVKVPTERVFEKSEDGKQKEYDRKLFPGYVMVKMIVTDETWYIVRNTRGVTGFVSPSSNKPIPLTSEEVSAMGLDIDEATGQVKIEIGFKQGDLVKIDAGPMEGWTGTVTSIDKSDNSAVITIPMFGRNTEITVDIVSLSKAN